MLEIRIPDIFNKIFSLVGSYNTIINVINRLLLALINIKDIFMDYKIYIISIIIINFTFLIYFISKFFIDNTLIIGYLTLSAALPAGPSIMIMVNQYSKNEGTAAIGVFITTILSVVTIPLIIYVLFI